VCIKILLTADEEHRCQAHASREGLGLGIFFSSSGNSEPNHTWRIIALKPQDPKMPEHYIKIPEGKI
jgi:hypothetical protein